MLYLFGSESREEIVERARPLDEKRGTTVFSGFLDPRNVHDSGRGVQDSGNFGNFFKIPFTQYN